MEPYRAEEFAELHATRSFDQNLGFAGEIGNHKIDPFLLRQAVERTARRAYRERGLPERYLDRAFDTLPTPPPAWRRLPTTGDVKIFALLIDFADEAHHNDQTFINERLFGAPPNPPYNSLREYYLRSSYGRLNLTGATLGWYQTSKRRSQIPMNTGGREALIKEAINHFNAAGHDFSQYDNNGDGVIDYFMVFWAGPAGDWATFWWGYQTGFNDAGYTVDGVRLGKYSWQWEGRPVGSAFSPVTCIHETGHALGLPDLYDYKPSQGPKGGVGGLDMMDANQFDHNCFSKCVLDWIEPYIISDGRHTMTFDPIENHGAFTAVWPGIESGDIFSELFMVENQQRLANDAGLMNEGLLIWHVDACLDGGGADYSYDNSYTAHKFVRLMEADGLEEIEAGRWANAGDFYVQGKTFTPATTPASTRYDGKPSNVSVTDIGALGDQMRATIMVEDFVTLYQDSWFKGAYQTLDEGRYDISALTIGNDIISSVRVPIGWSVTLFEHSGFGGASRTFNVDAPTLPGFNDKTSSVIVQKHIQPVIFEHNDYLGQYQVLNPQRYDFSGTPWNDRISSVQVPPGWRVTLYEHAGCQGARKVLTGNVMSLAEFNDITTCVVVEQAVLPVVYEHNGYFGRPQMFEPGRYDISELSFGNDMIRSVRVPHGWTVTLYEHAGFLGRSKVLLADTPALPDFNDQTSSIVVQGVQHAIMYQHVNYQGH